MNIVSKKLNVFTPSNAEKAFIYQQTQDLSSYIQEVTPIAVLLEKLTDSEIIYIVTFILGVPPFSITSRSEGQNFSEACISAKNQMKTKLFKITQNLEESKERIQFIEKLKKNVYFH